ncbi:hypothetical protein [Burkholderia sp. BCC0398]|uniref:hypothetical protein n=2 Tax=Burkholderiaceae TaxID=119060 RepID=UPI00158DCA2A|nr:hypothetical protein [Burkholderia sp. BCC0398]
MLESVEESGPALRQRWRIARPKAIRYIRKRRRAARFAARPARFRPAVPHTAPRQRGRIDDATRLTPTESCKMLRIQVAEFDRWASISI